MNKLSFIFFFMAVFCSVSANNIDKDKENTYNIEVYADLKSDILPFDTFDKPWDTLPAHKNNNHATGNIGSKLYYNFDDIKAGVFIDHTFDMNINSGFIQTWYYANKDFDTLLKKSDIGKSITTTPINGKMLYYDAQGIFLEKKINYDKNNYFFISSKIFKAKDIQYLKVNGSNTKDKFKMSLDYYYSDKNYISKNNKHDQYYKGKGYGFDIRYIYKNDPWKIKVDIKDIYTYIKYDSITYMHYDFESGDYLPNVKECIWGVGYIKDNGTQGCRSFGTGYYIYDTKLKLKLPVKYKLDISYTQADTFSTGAVLDIYQSAVYQQPYIIYKNYKLGYTVQTKSLDITASYDNIIFSISNKLEKNSKEIQSYIKITF